MSHADDVSHGRRPVTEAADRHDFAARLRAELVAAAERERARRLPRPGPVATSTIVGAAAAAVLAALVLFAATGGLRGDAQVATPTPVPTPVIDGRALFGGSLQPGVRYRTRVFVPALSFAVADTEWFMSEAAELDGLVLERRNRTPGRNGSERAPRQFLAFRRVTEVYDPGIRGLQASRVPGPLDYHDWLSEHPDLRVEGFEQVTVAGVAGEAFDVEVRFTRPAHHEPRCRLRTLAPCAAIAPGDAYFDGTRMRTIVLRTEPEPLVINEIGRSAADLEQLEAAATQVLDTLRIGVR